MADLPIIQLRAKDDTGHIITGVLLGEVSHILWPACWVMIPNESGWHDVPAAVATPVLLNKSHWELLE